MSDDFIPHREGEWKSLDATETAEGVYQPTHSRVLIAGRLDSTGVDRVLLLEFSDEAGKLQIELSGAAARVVADALIEGSEMV